MPERLTSNRKVIGTKQLRKALKAGRVRTAYVAADADPILREPLVEQCDKKSSVVKVKSYELSIRSFQLSRKSDTFVRNY